MNKRVKHAKKVSKKPLTPSEAKAYSAFAALRAESPVNPSAQDVGERIGNHVSHAARLLSSLVDKGWLIKEPNKYRSLQLAG